MKNLRKQNEFHVCLMKNLCLDTTVKYFYVS
jgi:hypothetical protein